MSQNRYTDWTVRTLIKLKRKGQVVVNNPAQRGPAWKRDIKKRSLFINSVIIDSPVPPIYANKVCGIYDVIDGQQRLMTICDYVSNDFALSADTPNVLLESGETYVIANKRFDDLPEELQNRIKEFSLTVQYRENSSQDEIRDAMFRLNNGKPFSVKELSRVKSNCLELIQEIAKHELLQTALSADAKNRYTHEEYVVKTWMAFYEPNPSFESKDTRALLERVVITPEQVVDISASYNRILEAYKHIHAKGKDCKTVCATMIRGIHLIALAVMAKQSIEDDIPTESFAECVKKFYSGTNGISVDAKYNEASGQGFKESAYIKARHRAILRHYKRYVNSQSQ